MRKPVHACWRLAVTALVLFAAPTRAQTPAEVMQRILDATNARNVEAVVALLHPDVVLEDFHPQRRLSMRGAEAARGGFEEAFVSSPEAQTQLIRRLEIGPFVVDHTRTTGGWEQELLGAPEAIGIFDVRDGKAVRAWVLRGVAQTDQRPLDVFERFVEALNAKDEEATLTLLHPEAKFNVFAGSVTISLGPALMRQLIPKSFAQAPNAKEEVLESASIGDYALAHTRVTGGPRGTREAVIVDQVSEGKITNTWLIELFPDGGSSPSGEARLPE